MVCDDFVEALYCGFRFDLDLSFVGFILLENTNQNLQWHD